MTVTPTPSDVASAAATVATTTPSTTSATTSSPAAAPTTTGPEFAPGPADVCAAVFHLASTASVADERLIEVSGIAASTGRPGVVWMHNDSGDEARVFGVDERGETVVIHELGVAARDWEDMAVADGYVYVGDIGDNKSERDFIEVHRFPEPTPAESGPLELETIRLTYPDGPHNAEALFVGPDDWLVIGTKEKGGGSAGFYGLPVADAFGGGSELELTHLADIELSPVEFLTAGDAGHDRLLLRTYLQVLAYPWPEGWSVDQVLGQMPCSLPSPREQQGEALALTADGGYLTVSEGLRPPIHRGATR